MVDFDMGRYLSLLLFISSTILSQSKVNISYLLLYGGKYYLPTSDKPFTGKVFDLWEYNGAKKFEVKFKDGQSIGDWVYYYLDGSILNTINNPDKYYDFITSMMTSATRTYMTKIYNASKIYYQTRGEWPSEIDDLERAGQLNVNRSVKEDWTFELQMPYRIDAISTENFRSLVDSNIRAGTGHLLRYWADENRFDGYGSIQIDTSEVFQPSKK